MADKPKTNVDKFFEIYDADPALQARVQQAMDCYPGSLEIRDVMTEHVLLPVAEELGLPFTLKELRNYELLKWGRQHQDRELTDDEMAEIAKLDKGVRYYNRTDEALAGFAAWQPEYEKA